MSTDNVAISFDEYEPEVEENPYTQTIAELITALETRPNLKLTVKSPYADAQKTQFKIQRAANAAGKTAKMKKNEDDVKVVGHDEDGNEVREGQVVMIFTLVPMHKARRRGKSVSSSKNEENGSETESAPTDSSSESTDNAETNAATLEEGNDADNVTPIAEQKPERSNRGRNRA